MYLIISIGSLVIPSFYYWIYPHPQNVKKRKADLCRLHEARVEHIMNAIDTAKSHQNDGSRVYGGAEPWKQAERDELVWQEKLNQENVEHADKIKELDGFPWTNAFVLFGIFLTSIGLHLTRN